MTDKPCIYVYTNLLTGQQYVGQTIKLKRRNNDHINNGYNGSYIDRALKKYSVECFDLSIVEEFDCINGDVLNEREIYWIKQFDTFNNGYNLTKGGDGRKGYIIPEYQKKYGKDNSFYGRTHTEESKSKMRKSSKGQVPWNKGNKTPEHYKRYGKDNHMYGKKLSEETKEKIRKKLLGSNNPNYGKMPSEETKRKIKEQLLINDPREKSYKITTPEGKEYIIKGINRWCRVNDINPAGMFAVVKGRQKTTHGGYKCEYINE